MVEPIKADLAISDTQIGVLQGLAFLLIYALAGIPAGYLIDRVHRIRLIVGAICLWSAMCGYCGIAHRFISLFVGRAGVGIGEAVLTPATYSLISDIFPTKRRGLAIGFYQSGAGVGAGLALILGGALLSYLAARGPVHLPLLGEVAPWRLMFLILSGPGLLIAALTAFMVEPARREASLSRPRKAQWTLLRRFYRENRATLLMHHGALGLTGLVMNGTIVWATSLFVRVHGWQPGQVGPIMGLAVFAGSLGLLGGGALSDALLHRGPQARFAMCAALTLAGVCSASVLALTDSPVVAASMVILIVLSAGSPYGAATAALQDLIPSSICGMVSALFLLAFSLISALGPLLVGLAADHLFPQHLGIRYALLVVLPTACLIATALFLLLIPHYSRSLKRAAALN